MKTALLVALALCLSGVTLAATAPVASACNPPNCPGWGGCRLVGGSIYVDPDTMTVTVDPIFECYY